MANQVALAAWPSGRHPRNPSAATSRPAPAPPDRRPDSPLRATLLKDMDCTTCIGDRGESGQGKKAPEHSTCRSSGSTYSKPDARVKLIPAEDTTYVRHVQPFGRTVGSARLWKKHCRRSLTPPPSARKVSSSSVHVFAAHSSDLVTLHTKLHKKPDQPEACWKGKFEVTVELTHTCNGLEAHLPYENLIKVYGASKQMPGILKLDALPLSCLWPKMFKMKPPNGEDIGLCFISSLQRPNGNFDLLLENISSHIGLRTDIGTTELLIFSSKLLTKDYQKKDGKFYFWGVFRKHLRKKQLRSNNHKNNNVEISNASLSDEDSCDRSEDIGMNLDLTKVKETKSDKKCLAMLKARDSNIAVSNAALTVSFLTGSCSPDPADNFLFSLLGDTSCYFIDVVHRFALVDPWFLIKSSSNCRYSM